MRKYRKKHKTLKSWVKAKIDVIFYLVNGRGLARQGDLTSRKLKWESSLSTDWEAWNKPLFLFKANRDHTHPFKITRRNAN